MKKVKVKYINIDKDGNAPISEGVLFESMADVSLLQKELSRAELGVMQKFIKSGESVDRLNHIVSGFRPLEKCLASLAIVYGTTRGDNAIYQLGNASGAFINSLTSQLIKGRQVFMNPSGGLCPVEGSLEIIESEDFEEFPNPPKYFIGQSAKIINLENDFELEKVSQEFMDKRFKDFRNHAHFTDMKTLTQRDFMYIFKTFVEVGGEYVYVYTTGIDHEQMYEYSRYALESGLKKFIFDFNSGVDKEIQKFINWLKERAEVELINN